MRKFEGRLQENCDQMNNNETNEVWLKLGYLFTELRIDTKGGRGGRTIANSVSFTNTSVKIGAFPNATPTSKIWKNLPMDQKDQRRRSVSPKENKNSSNVSAACLFKKMDAQYCLEKPFISVYTII